MTNPSEAKRSPMILEGDEERIWRFNQTDRDFPHQSTLVELLQPQMARLANEIAVICDRSQGQEALFLTYGQLNQKANQLAHLLRQKGVGRGDVVGLLVERSFAMIIGLMGILKAGGAYLPISPDNPAERVRYMLKDCAVRVLLTQGKLEKHGIWDGLIIDLDEPTTYGGPTDDLERVNTPDDLAYVIYTSGSTGKPKGVMIEHRSVVNRLHWMQSAYPLGSDDVILQKTPYCFDVSVWELFWWALVGAKLCLLRPGGERVPILIAEAIRRHRITVLHFVPSMLNVFLESFEGKEAKVRHSLLTVRHLFASGEALSTGHVKRFNQIVGRLTGARLTNLYGPTEATVDVSYFDCPAHDDFDCIPIGRPIDNTRFYILDNGLPTRIGESGELCIAGVGLARGYMNNPGLTQDRFVENPIRPGERIYRTGDIARWLPDGNIEYLGRLDDQVKIRGFRIELGEIENTIREFPGVGDCLVLAKRHSETVTMILAYFVSRQGVEVSLEALRSHLKQQLPDYMMPNHFERIDRIPLTANGKADRAALPVPALQCHRS